MVINIVDNVKFLEPPQGLHLSILTDSYKLDLMGTSKIPLATSHVLYALISS